MSNLFFVVLRIIYLFSCVQLKGDGNFISLNDVDWASYGLEGPSLGTLWNSDESEDLKNGFKECVIIEFSEENTRPASFTFDGLAIKTVKRISLFEDVAKNLSDFSNFSLMDSFGERGKANGGVTKKYVEGIRAIELYGGDSFLRFYYFEDGDVGWFRCSSSSNSFRWKLSKDLQSFLRKVEKESLKHLPVSCPSEESGVESP
ncbi:hypothetical protein [Roseibacillus persicicus]|uniref:hypothetical protein n=1 Tax=Roseibacillus persicicus TaxID=454148 RepID=UPI00280DA09E|nr:hypothetical protein [Roseibacillus persicicus]MDQ8191002.1 hypothetical protein [Roseibacillus persicicus]